MENQIKHAISPFINEKSFEPDIGDLKMAEGSVVNEEPDSPFLAVYQLEESNQAVDPKLIEVSSLITELYDQEFDNAVYELINEAAELYETQFETETGIKTSSENEAMWFLQEHYAPLVLEVENLLDKMADDIEKRDLDSMSESELDEFMDQYHLEQHYSPAFEGGLWGAIKRKAKKYIKKGYKWAKKRAKALAKRLVKIALRKLKKYVKPILRKVLAKAIRKIPAYLQPAARKLAKKYGLQEFETHTDLGMYSDTTPEIAEIQKEFDFLSANLLLAESEAQQDLIFTEALVAAEEPYQDVLDNAEKARDQFVAGLAQLEDGEDPTPLVENFLPAIIPLVKLGLKFYGRPKVVNFLARYLARLIRRFVGPKYTTMLSRAIVDAGFRLVGLETSPEDETAAAHESVASAIEETVRRVASLPEYILDDEALLEGFVFQAFEESLIGNFPQVLQERIYEDRPELRETGAKHKGMWLLRKRKGKRRYKKYSHVLKKRIDPHKIKAIKTWSGRSLARVLRRKMGTAIGKEFEANIHLFEAIPGAILTEINRTEKQLSGLSAAKMDTGSMLHPLTPEAAGILLENAGLGRAVPNQYLVDPKKICVGQRFYYIESPEISGYMAPASYSYRHPCCDTHLVFDFIQNQIQVYIFLNETEAQQIAIKLNKRLPIGSVLATLNARYVVGVNSAFARGMTHQVKVIHGSLNATGTSQDVFKWIPLSIQDRLKERLLEWLGITLYNNFKLMAGEFISSAQNQASGLTLKISCNNVSGLGALGKLLAGESVVLQDIEFPDALTNAEIRLTPGFRYE